MGLWRDLPQPEGREVTLAWRVLVAWQVGGPAAHWQRAERRNLRDSEAHIRVGSDAGEVHKRRWGVALGGTGAARHGRAPGVCDTAEPRSAAAEELQH